MLRIALRMLFGDRVKYVTLVLGLAFATLLINQQGAIFLGLLIRSTGLLQNVNQPDLWVLDRSVRWVAEFRPLPDRVLDRVRSVPGVKWAEPLFNGFAVAELGDGSFQRVNLIGLPRSSLVGQPPAMVAGSIEDLRRPDAIIVEESTARTLLRGARVGDVLKINDRRAVIVGVCKAKKGFESNALAYATFENALNFVPQGRNTISYILVKAQDPADIPRIRDAVDRIEDARALTRDQFALSTINFIIAETGIGINFFVTIVLGLLVGLALSAAVFYQFIAENLRYFAVLKSLGARNPTLAAMVLLQALVVGVIGYGMGMGAASAFTIVSRVTESELDVLMPWQLMAGSLGAIVLCVCLASVLALRRVLSVPPGMVFSG